MKTYEGKRINPVDIWVIRIGDDGQVTTFDHRPSLRIRKHSPDGFNWGYAGSGPAQLALALLLDVGLSAEAALVSYQDFKLEVVSRWGEHWMMTSEAILSWVEAWRGEMPSLGPNE